MWQGKGLSANLVGKSEGYSGNRLRMMEFTSSICSLRSIKSKLPRKLMLSKRNRRDPRLDKLNQSSVCSATSNPTTPEPTKSTWRNSTASSSPRNSSVKMSQVSSSTCTRKWTWVFSASTATTRDSRSSRTEPPSGLI